MKRKTILLLTALIAYCGLFYGQSTGINVLIFNVILLTILLILDKSLLRSKVWLAVAAGTLITGTGALLYGNFLSAFGNVFSLLLLTHLSASKESSLVFALVQSAWSYITIPYFKMDRLMSPQEKPENAAESRFSVGNVLKIFIPLAVLLLFTMIYRASNPIFNKFIGRINLDFLSWGFIWFAFWGFVLVYGFFNQHLFSSLLVTDRSKGNLLSAGIRENEPSLFDGLSKEAGAAILTFVLLNLLLLLVNVLDLVFILGGSQDSVVNYSQYVHQGINSSIFSVIIAMLVTLYFFRGNLNFIAKSRQIKTLALIWILLNAVLIFTCFYKNTGYIQESGLTHKRIGVYFYLLLTFISLVTTWIKITGMKSNWFLIRVNMWQLYLVLVFSALFNWNKIIVEYNMQYQSSVEREYYLYSLKDPALPALLANWESMPQSYAYPTSDNFFSFTLKSQTRRFIRNYQNAGWQSWNFESTRIYALIQQTKYKQRAK